MPVFKMLCFFPSTWRRSFLKSLYSEPVFVLFHFRDTQTPFLCRRTDTYPRFCHSTSFWAVMLPVIRHLRHWNAKLRQNSELEEAGPRRILICFRKESVLRVTLCRLLCFTGHFRAIACSVMVVAWKLSSKKKSDLSIKSKLSIKTCSVNVALVPFDL